MVPVARSPPPLIIIVLFNPISPLLPSHNPQVYQQMCIRDRYKIPNRVDVKKIRVEFESSYEPTGPYGAKSIGEIVINTPGPAIAEAVYNACGVRCLLYTSV